MSNHHSPIPIRLICDRPIMLAPETNTIRRHARLRAGLPADRRRRSLKRTQASLPTLRSITYSRIAVDVLSQIQTGSGAAHYNRRRVPLVRRPALGYSGREALMMRGEANPPVGGHEALYG